MNVLESFALSFTNAERRLLLNVTGIGPGVIDRLESLGIDSLPKLRQIGVDEVVQRICASMGSRAWANRRAALCRALQRA